MKQLRILIPRRKGIQNAINVVKKGVQPLWLRTDFQRLSCRQIFVLDKGRVESERMMNYFNCKGNMPEMVALQKANPRLCFLSKQSLLIRAVSKIFIVFQGEFMVHKAA